ncbi:MAG: hypothetical protein KatS3mg065_0790 [Chloroflexota bacterium]|nr:MAG: hypothetical protein KatS3mg065_0790 [Chloroflexota bacterium]
MQILSSSMEPAGSSPTRAPWPSRDRVPAEPHAADRDRLGRLAPTTLRPTPPQGPRRAAELAPVEHDARGRCAGQGRADGGPVRPRPERARRAPRHRRAAPTPAEVGLLALPGVGTSGCDRRPRAIVPVEGGQPARGGASRPAPGRRPDLADAPDAHRAPTRRLAAADWSPQSDASRAVAAWLAALIAESVPDRPPSRGACRRARGLGRSRRRRARPGQRPAAAAGRGRASPHLATRSGSVEIPRVRARRRCARRPRRPVSTPPTAVVSPRPPDRGPRPRPAAERGRRAVGGSAGRTSGSLAPGPAVARRPAGIRGRAPPTRHRPPARNRPESRTASALRLDPSAVPQPSLPESPALLHAPSPSARSGRRRRQPQRRPPVADRMPTDCSQRSPSGSGSPIRDRLPALEATFHDPTLGSVRLAVRGLPDGPIEAVVVVATEAAARGLERAAREADRRSADPLGIELRIRVEPASSAPVTADARPEHRAPGHAGVHDGLGQGGPSGDQTSARRDPAGADAGLGADDGGRQGDPSTPEGPVGPSGSARRGRSTGPTTAPLAGPSRGSVAARSGGIDIRL